MPRPGRRRQHSTRPVWMGQPPLWVTVLKAIILTMIVIVMLYPLVYVVLWSLASARAATSGDALPTSFSFDTYLVLLNSGTIPQAMLVTTGITVVGTVLSMIFTTTLAYGLSRTREVPGAKPILYLVLATMLFSAGMIPNYLLVRALGLLDTYAAVIIPGLISAFNMIVVRNFFMNLPQEIFDAARIDGAGELRIFTQIVLPLSKPILAVVSLFYAVGYWNTFFNALLYLRTPSKWPMQVVLNQYVVQGQNLTTVQPPGVPPPPGVTLQMAVIVLATLPILLVYPFVQRFFTKGVLTGAIKG